MKNVIPNFNGRERERPEQATNVGRVGRIYGRPRSQVSQFCPAMWSNTIIITLLLLALTSSYGGVVRRSIQKKPFQSGKELLSMKDASDAIKRSFKSAGKDLEDLARDLEQEVDEIAQLSAYINLTETEKMSEALAEAMNIKSVRRFIFLIFFLQLYFI